MYDALNEELRQVKEQMQARHRKQSKLKACQLRLTQAQQEASDLREHLSENQQVLDKLHGLSLLHLMAVIKGIEDTREEEIHRKVAQLNGKLTTAAALVDRLEDEKHRLQNELELTNGIEQKYENVLREKEQNIAEQENSALAQKLLEYTHQEADYNGEVKETEEALSAANDAKNALADCMESLRKAQNWGTMDMLGGGTITTMIKRSHMDDAQSRMDSASYYLDRLQRELQDLNANLTGSVELDKGGFLHFADYFFDGLFVDWAVQNRIKKAAAQVEEQYHMIDALTNDLGQRAARLKQTVEELQRKRKLLVEEA